MQSFKYFGIKLYEELRSQCTHYLYAGVKNDKFHEVEKVTKNNLTFFANHMHIPYHEENACTVSKRSVQNCKRSCAHKVARVHITVDGRTSGRTDG